MWVICPVAESHISQAEPCEAYAEKEKHGTYDEGFKGPILTLLLLFLKRPEQ